MDAELLRWIQIGDRPDVLVGRIQRHPELVRSNPGVLLRGAVSTNADPNIVRALLAACPEGLSSCDENGRTAVSHLSWIGLHKESASAILDTIAQYWPANDDGSNVPKGQERVEPRRLNPLLLQDTDGNTPLHGVCEARMLDSTIILRMLAICPGVSRMRNKEGKTPRDLAEDNWVLCNDGGGKGNLGKDLAEAFDKAKERATCKRRLTKMYDEGEYDKLIEQIKSCPHEAAVLRPWHYNTTALGELICTLDRKVKYGEIAPPKDKYVEIIRTLVEAFPEAIEMYRLGFGPLCDTTMLAMAISELEQYEVLQILIDTYPEALTKTCSDDRNPVHQALVEYGPYSDPNIEYGPDVDSRDRLVFYIIEKNPKCAFQYCGSDGTPIEVAMRMVLGGVIGQTEDREKAFSFLMKLLEAMHSARRKLDKKPAAEFRPIHAALQFIHNDVLEGVVNDQTGGFCNTGRTHSLRTGGIHTIEEGLEGDIELLYALAYLDLKKLWDNVLSHHPIDALAGMRRQLQQTYAIIRHDVLEEIIKRYPEELRKKDAEGLLPIDVAKKFLKCRITGKAFSTYLRQFKEEHKEDVGPTPEEKIFALLEG